MEHDEKEFEKIYAGYIIYDKKIRSFVGPDSEMWRVSMRWDAARFTKAGAMEFISENTSPDGELLKPGYIGDFEIQDAAFLKRPGRWD